MSDTPTSSSSQEVAEAEEVGAGRRVRNWAPAGAWGFFLAVFYAVLARFYQAAGGQIGQSWTMREENVLEAQMGSYRAGLLILVGGGACLMLAYRAFRTYPRWMPVVGGSEVAKPLMIWVVATPSLIGGVFAINHWLGASLVDVLDLLGLVDRDVSPLFATYDRLSAIWWDILFYEPWFLAMGICLVLATLQYAREATISRQVIKAVAWIAGVLGALLCVYSVNFALS